MDASLLTSLLNVQDWVLELQEGIAIYREPLFSLAYRLALLGFLIRGVRIVLAGGSELRPALQGVFMAALMLSLAPGINTLAITTWESMRVFAGQQLAEEFRTSSEILVDISESTQSILIAGAVLSTDPAIELAQDATGLVGLDEMQGIHTHIVRASGFATVALMIVVLFMFLMLVLTGLAVSIAGIFLPIGAGLLAFPGSLGMQFLGNYLRIVLSSLLLILLFPIGFQVVFHFTAVRPLTVMAEQMMASRIALNNTLAGIEAGGASLTELERLERQMETIRTRQAALRNDPAAREDSHWPLSFRRFTEAAQREMNALEIEYQSLRRERDSLKSGWFSGVNDILSANMRFIAESLSTMFQLIGLLVLGVIAGIIALMKLEGYISALVGGFFIGASAAVGGTALGMMALASRARSPKLSLGGAAKGEKAQPAGSIGKGTQSTSAPVRNYDIGNVNAAPRQLPASGNSGGRALPPPAARPSSPPQLPPSNSAGNEGQRDDR